MGIVFTCYLGRYCQIETLQKGNLKLNEYIFRNQNVSFMDNRIQNMQSTLYFGS